MLSTTVVGPARQVHQDLVWDGVVIGEVGVGYQGGAMKLLVDESYFGAPELEGWRAEGGGGHGLGDDQGPVLKSYYQYWLLSQSNFIALYCRDYPLYCRDHPLYCRGYKI